MSSAFGQNFAITTLTTAGGLNSPQGIAVDANGITYVADTASHVIRRIAVDGTVTTLAGAVGSLGSALDPTGGTAARFQFPRGVALNAAGDVLYVSDTGNHVVRKITLASAGGVVTAVSAFAGTSGTSAPFSNTAGSVTFFGPRGLAVDSAGDVYVADTDNHVIRKITSAGVVTTVAGSPGVTGPTNGDGATARFSSPFSVALNSTGATLYVADRGNHLIRQIVFSPSVSVSTLAGTSGVAGSTNADGVAAQFNFPSSVSVDSAGNVFVADTGNNALRRITGTTVTMVAGGTIGSANGTGTAAQFSGPLGVAARTLGSTVFVNVADTGNNLVRKGSLAAAPAVTSPSNQGGAAGTNANFSATVTGWPPSTSLQWQRQPGGTGSFVPVNPDGVYVISTSTTHNVATTTLTVNSITTAMQGDRFKVVATNSQGTAESATPATLAVTQAPSFAGVTTTLNFAVNQTSQYTIAASAGSPPITYEIVAPGVSGVTLVNGVLSWSPSSVADSTTIQIKATNSVGNTTQTFTLNVLPPQSAPVITSQPQNYSVPVGQSTASFSVTASANPAITAFLWKRESSPGSGSFVDLSNDGTHTISSSGTTSTLTVNSVSPSMNGNVFRVLVSNTVGTTTSGTAVLSIVQAPVFTNVASALFVVNQSNTFTFTATGSPAPTFNTSSTLPSGVSLNSTTGVLSGVPSDALGSPFQLVVTATNSGGTATMNPFTLTVSNAAAAAAISTQPVAATVQLGANATFTAAVTGSPEPTLRWQRQPAGTTGFVDLFDDGTFSGTTTTTLTVIGVAAGMTGDLFRLVATNTVNSLPVSAVSSLVALTVNIGTTITTFAGQAGVFGSDNGTGTAARFNTPASIAVDSSGNFYVADAANHVIRRITPTGVVTTLAGQPGASGNSDGVGNAARFNAPTAVAVDSVGTVYVADTYNHTIRSISQSGGVTTLAGLANNSGSADGTGTTARFAFPGGIAVDSSTNIYVADSNNHTIRRVTTSGVVTTFAGTAGSAGSLNGNGTGARFNYPNGLAIGSGGVLYVADSFNHLIRRISTLAEVTIVAGTVGIAGSIDANGTAARFNQPTGVAVDTAGNVYIADTFNHTIRKIALNGDVTTLAGAAGVLGATDGVGTAARFNQPFALTVDANSNLYIADTRNHTIRRSGTTSAPAIQTQPQNRVAPLGATATFSVVASGTPSPSYQWQRQAAGTSGFVNLGNDAIYTGVSTATLTVANVFSLNNGDQYRVIVTNGISPVATSEVATLTIGEAPVFTNATTASTRATDPFSFTFTASGSPASSFTATGLPVWLTLTATTGVLSGTPPDGSQGQYPITVIANNGSTASQTFTLSVQPAIIAPAISGQPGPLAVNQGSSATFSVTVTGTAPFSYQWRRNGVSISGATGASYTLTNVQPVHAGSYSVIVSNTAGSVPSNAVALTVITPPIIVAQPQPQTVLAGTSATLEVAATGGTGTTYQWRRNGLPIAGATNSVLFLPAVAATDAGNYDVVVTNALGSAVSSTAIVSLTTTTTPPIITSRPASRTVLAGSTTVLRVGATGAPTPGYQWRKNGVSIAGASSASLTLTNVQAGDAASYDVVVSNANGSVTVSPGAAVRVIARSYSGIYFGSFGGGIGNFALYVRPDNTGVFLGYIPGSTAPVMNLNLLVNDAGEFSFSQSAVASAPTISTNSNEPDRSAALGSVVVLGSIASDGTLSGTIGGGASASLSGSRAAENGATSNVAGFYQAGATSGAAVAYTIAGPNAQAFVIAQSGNASDGGLGAVTTAGTVTVTTTRSTISESISASTGTITGSSSGAVSATLAGGSDTAVSLQRLVNISSRARVATGDSIAIAGFVISGEEAKPVLIRAVGPSIGPGTPFNVPSPLATPRLELFRGNTSLAVNSGIAGNRLAIDAAGLQVAAFALGTSGADAAMIVTLEPGTNYTAQVSSTTGTAGIALVEVYDLSAAAVGQKLLNISTRAPAGTAEATLIAGFVIPAGPSKRILVRGVGPGLGAFNLGGLLAQPQLQLLSGSTTIAQNANWTTSPDAAAITTASLQVGAFAMVNNDSALIVTLAPGNYTAQVLGAGGTTGLALIEVYELP